jgi:phosphoglycerol geranylgeranyltransferase
MILELINNAKKKKQRLLAVLADPDDCDDTFIKILEKNQSKYDILFYGGSIILDLDYEKKLRLLRSLIGKPIVLFPGDISQISPTADGILLLSLISGRNPELLIGRHVQAAAQLMRSKLEIIPTGYILIDGGKSTSVSYISNTIPIPRDKPGIAAATGAAGQLLGLKAIYLEAGSGAAFGVPAEMIQEVKKLVTIPVIVGGGIRSKETAKELYDAGADMIVIGNGAKNNPLLIEQINKIRKK